RNAPAPRRCNHRAGDGHCTAAPRRTRRGARRRRRGLHHVHGAVRLLRPSDDHVAGRLQRRWVTACGAAGRPLTWRADLDPIGTRVRTRARIVPASERLGELCTSYTFAERVRDALRTRTLQCWDRNGVASRSTPPAIPLRIAKVCDKEAAPFRPNPKGCHLKSRLTALPSLAVRGVLSSRQRLVSRDFRWQRDRATCAELPPPPMSIM